MRSCTIRIRSILALVSRQALIGTFGACGIFLAAPGAQAALIVDWGGNYVSTSQILTKDGDLSNIEFLNSGDTTTFGGRGGKAFSLSTVRSPATNYSGNSATFYGGVANIRPGGGTTGTGGAEFSIINSGANDLLQVKPHIGHAATGARFAILPVWEKSDFMAGAHTQTISFDASQELQVSRFSVTVNDITGDGDPAFNALRWWVQSGGNFYVSEDLTGNDMIAEQTYTTTDFSTLVWTQHNLTEGSYSRLYVDNTTFATSSSVLTDVTAVGFYVTSINGPIATDDGINFSSFEVEAGVVPEPAHLALLGLVGLLLTRRRFRI